MVVFKFTKKRLTEQESFFSILVVVSLCRQDITLMARGFELLRSCHKIIHVTNLLFKLKEDCLASLQDELFIHQF